MFEVITDPEGNVVSLALKQDWAAFFQSLQQIAIASSRNGSTTARPTSEFKGRYEGMTFWVTVNPHHYFPDSWKSSYPDWLAPLGIAIGQSAKNIAGNPWGGYKEYFVGLDIDLRKIPVGDDSDLFRFIKSEFNFLRLPLPTIRFSPSGTWIGFYF